MATDLVSSITSIANEVVVGGYNQSQIYANSALNAAYQALGPLANFNIQPLPVRVNFTVPGGPGKFVAPKVPTKPTTAYTAPPDVGGLQLAAVALANSAGGAPPDPNISYAFNLPGGQPGELSTTPYGTIGDLETVVVPGAPTLPADPALGTLLPITLPPVPPINEIPFEGKPPTEIGDIPPLNFDFTETPYSSTLLDAVKSKITILLEGGTGLTPAQELMSFERARSREDQISFRALQEEDEKFSSKGFTAPNGILAKQRRIVQQQNQNASRDHSRKVELDNKLLMIENLKFAVAQGIACEQMLLTAHLATEERRFLVARFLYDSVLSIFNARIAVYNAQVQRYLGDAQVFRDRVQAELTKAEIYRTQVDAQRLVGEVNKTTIDAYEAQLRASMVIMERYKITVDAAKVTSDINLSRIEAFRARVQAFGEEVRAYATQWEAYKVRVDAEKGKIEAGAVAAQIYGIRMQGWNTKRQADFEELKAKVSIEDLKVQKYGADVQAFIGKLQGARAKIDADTQMFSAEAQVYAAGGQVAEAQASAADRQYQLVIAKGQSEAELALKQAEILITQAQQTASLLLEARKGVAQTTSQLAASAMSMFSLSGSVGLDARVGLGYSGGVNYNYSGDAGATQYAPFI